MERSTMIGLAVGVAALAAGWWFWGRKSQAATSAGKAVAAALAPRVRVETSTRVNAKDTVQVGRDAGPGASVKTAADVKAGSDLARSTWGVG
jgi:hypothetical protein